MECRESCYCTVLKRRMLARRHLKTQKFPVNFPVNGNLASEYLAADSFHRHVV